MQSSVHTKFAMDAAVEVAGTMAPPLSTAEWFNVEADIKLESLRGRVVVIHTFQMLCPACVSHGLPQAMKIHRTFEERDVVVLGLHTVFEHHAAMAPSALEVFFKEYRVTFPVAVDAPASSYSLADPIPMTMQAYGLQGTPSLMLIDKRGFVRFTHFGVMDNMALGAILGQLIAE